MGMNAATLKTELEAAIDTELTASIGEDYTNMAAEFKTKFLAGLSKAIADTVVAHITDNAEVAFAEGDITGADSNADTHELLSASSGTVS